METSTSASLFERAQRVLPSGYTRNMVITDPHPLYVAKGDGCWVTDVDGNKFIDWVNNFSSQIHGHNKKEIIDTITRQAGHVQSTTMPSEWEIKLAEILVDRLPGVDKVRFMNSGTEANIVAVKVARAYTGKSKIAKMEGGYHGQYDLLEASFQPMPDQWGDAAEPAAVAYQPATPQSLLDETVILPLNDIEASRALLRKHADQLAGVILDPWRLQIGMVEPHPNYVAMLREETEKLGVVLIFDEVWALRLGYHGAQGALNITPDLTTMGKIIGGGQPIGALGGKDEFMSVFTVKDGATEVKHSGTFTANPMSMAAGCVAMELMTPEAFADMEAKGDRLRAGLKKLCADFKLPARVVGHGSMSVLLMTETPMENYRQLLMVMAGGLLQKMTIIQKLLFEENVMTLRGGFVGSTPMTNDDIDFTINGYGNAIKRFLSEYADQAA